MKIIIAGSRNLDSVNKGKLSRIITHLLSNIPHEELEIVSGTARGADRFGERWAKRRGIKIKRFPADWNAHGSKMAGYVRNRQMAAYADGLIAIWDGESRGTKMMIDLARSMGLKVRVILMKDLV